MCIGLADTPIYEGRLTHEDGFPPLSSSGGVGVYERRAGITPLSSASEPFIDSYLNRKTRHKTVLF